ncbi:MAG: heme ABC transporter ATP-binding protein CcmA, partial [Pseudomonadota bacterium]
CSAGQRRRLGLARLLIAPRRLWLLDEPTVSLDAASAERFMAAVSAHLAAGGLAVIATHIALGLSETQVLEMASPPAGAEPADAADPFLAGAWE